MHTPKEAEAARVRALSALQRGTWVRPERVTVRGYLEDEWLPVFLCRWGGLEQAAASMGNTVGDEDTERQLQALHDARGPIAVRDPAGPGQAPPARGSTG